MDIYYGGRYLQSQVATFTSEAITLPNPAAVVARISDITDPALFTRLLSGEIQANSGEVCAPRQTRGCGRINPEVVGVIFDENRFRLDLFINRRYLQTRQADVQNFLPPSDGELAFLQNLSVTASGNHSKSEGQSDNNSNDYTLNGDSLLSWRENSLVAGWDYTKEQHLTVDRIYGQREFEGLAWQGGMISTQGFGFNFSISRSLLGARVGTSSNTRQDGDFTGGIPLDVFLPTRGRVELRREGRLLSSAFFEAGNHEFDTSSLPDGSYDIEIRVVDDLGRELSRETRFFAKQGRLPARGEWEWFAEGGKLLERQVNTKLPRTTNQFLSRTGVGRRLSDTWSGTLSLAADNDEALAEAEFFHVGRGWDMSPYIMLDKDNNRGAGLDLQTRVADVSLSGNYRRLWKSEETTQTDNIPSASNDENSLLGSGFEQFSGSMGASFWSGSLNYRYSMNRRQDDRTESHSVSWRKQLWRTNDYDLDFDISVSESDDNRVAIASFTLNKRQNQWNFRAAPTAQWNRSDGQTRTDKDLRLNADWDDGDWLDGDLRFNSGLSLRSEEKRINGQVRYANHRGSADIALAHLQTRSSQATSYSLNMSTSLLTDGEYLAVGGENRAQSAAVVYVEGRKGDRFDVMVDGRREAYAVVGQPSLVALSPYRQYEISVRPSGTAIYRFDEKVERITLYPGNVVRMDVEAVPLQLAFGRILFSEKTIVPARITGGLVPVTVDEYGLFQIEVPANIPFIRVELDNGWYCRVALPDQPEEDILRLGTVKLSEADCQPQLEGELAVGQADEK